MILESHDKSHITEKIRESYDAYEFSVILPVYNVEEYLREAIESITGQTVGISCIQLIIVNDGSTDKSGVICREYEEKYPDNIVYVEKENGGVSAARNTGLGLASGRIIAFLDGDDKWSENAFFEVKRFFDQHPDIGLATGRLCYYGKRTNKEHPLDYKYDKEKIIDISETYDHPEYSVAHAFFRADLIGANRFDEKLRYSEDNLFINRIILKEKKFALLPSAVYLYRLRDDGSSAVNNSRFDKAWYFDTTQNAYLKLIKISNEMYGEVIRYIQYLMLHLIQWRLTKPFDQVLDEDETGEYISMIKEIISHIGIDIVLGHRIMPVEMKACVLRLKYGEDKAALREALKKLKESIRPEIRIMKPEGHKIHLSGFSKEKLVDAGLKLFVMDSEGRRDYAEYRVEPGFDQNYLSGEVTEKGYSFNLDMHLRNGRNYTFHLEDDGGEVTDVKPMYGKFCKLSSSVNMTYFISGNHMIRRNTDVILVRKKNDFREEKYWEKLNSVIEEKGRHDVVEIRKEVKKEAGSSSKPVWLIMDRTERAGDNGEALFRYLMRKKVSRSVDIYFVISEESSDYERLKKKGNVIAFGSKEHFVKLLLADLIISSMWEDWVFNPFRSDWKYYTDLRHYKFVFLQSGVTKDDFSKRLCRNEKNISLFITSSEREKESIINGDYGYGDDVVKLTGMPRFDLLKRRKEKLIAVIPTWRKALASSVIHGTSRRLYLDRFKESDFFEFYDGLINDEKLLKAMKEKGYKGIFCLHPAHAEHARDFHGNDVFSVEKGIVDFNRVISRSAMLVTDYSSIAMDFAYLKKPVLYAQFDKDSFYSEHIYDPGYFDYERDGFGPVSYDHDSTVKELIRMIKSGARMESEYRSRAGAFFEFKLRMNCRRVLKELKTLQGL